MKKWLLLAIPMLISGSNLFAQNAPTGGFSANGIYYSSSPQEGYLNGAGRLAAGQGAYLKGLGEYEINHQQARRLWLENNFNQIQGRWYLRDTHRARIRQLYPNYITREKQRLKMKAEIKELAKQQEGSKESPTGSHFSYRGKVFRNYKEFQQSQEYLEMKAEAKLRHIHKQVDEAEAREKHFAGLLIEKRLRMMTPGARVIFLENEANRRRVERIMGKEWVTEYEKPEKNHPGYSTNLLKIPPTEPYTVKKR